MLDSTKRFTASQCQSSVQWLNATLACLLYSQIINLLFLQNLPISQQLYSAFPEVSMMCTSYILYMHGWPSSVNGQLNLIVRLLCTAACEHVLDQVSKKFLSYVLLRFFQLSKHLRCPNCTQPCAPGCIFK